MPELASCPLLARGNRLSVMPLTDGEFDAIVRAGGNRAEAPRLTPTAARIRRRRSRLCSVTARPRARSSPREQSAAMPIAVIVTTSCVTTPGTRRPAGGSLTQLGIAADTLAHAGWTTVIASPAGGPVPFDPRRTPMNGRRSSSTPTRPCDSTRSTSMLPIS